MTALASLSVSRIKQWLQARPQEQRWGVVLSGCLVCLGIWYLVWGSYYQGASAALSNQIIPLQQKIDTIAKQNHAMQQALNNPKILQKHQQFLSQLNDINAKLRVVSSHLVSANDMVKALKSMVTQNTGLELISLENTGNLLLPTTDMRNQKLYRHDFVMIFKGNYFSTLNYLKSLEKLPWQFYWDVINYEVTSYPGAKITLKLHTVNTEEGLINV